MTTLTVYGQPNCQPCEGLKMALKMADIPFNFIDITREEPPSYFNHRSVPQLYYGTHHIGNSYNDYLTYTKGT